MRYGWAMLTLVAWGLWFGGMGALVLFVSFLFARDRPTAMHAAPRLFEVFEAYQIVVGGIAIVAAGLWRFTSAAGKSINVIFVLLVVAAVGVMISATSIRPRMERLRADGLSAGPEFQSLHKRSEKLYMCQAMALLAAGVMMPVAMMLNDRPMPATPRRTETEAAPPSAPPGEPAGPTASA
jgi:hypothetical protein